MNLVFTSTGPESVRHRETRRGILPAAPAAGVAWQQVAWAVVRWLLALLLLRLAFMAGPFGTRTANASGLETVSASAAVAAQTRFTSGARSTSDAAATVTLPAGLPTRFGIGLSAHPDESGLYGWMQESGVPWDYAYQYLAAGVNTGSGWATWNSNAQFATMYAQGAAARGAVPVFTYYMLLQSTGTCDGCEEAKRDLSNLNDAALMARYYADFALLMKRLGPVSPATDSGVAGFGRPAIVHVEPDLSAYAQQAVLRGERCFGFCAGSGNDPALLRAAVARSGFAEVQKYPDTYAGFNRALLHLRDLYAPNVLLAFHYSAWATGYDVATSGDPGLDVAQQGALVGEFARLSGAGPLSDGAAGYDLLFTDVSDRDAGYYAQVLKSPGHWWDRLNVALPNFHRWEAFATAVNAAARVPAFVWQIPLGNQYFRSQNNSNGHYQDNRAEYFFEHLDELQSAGFVGLLFGRGNDGSTANTDDRKDGITNPAPLCSSDGLSSGQICADHDSTVADDDGGYLRLAAVAYYAAPRPLVTAAIQAQPGQ